MHSQSIRKEGCNTFATDLRTDEVAMEEVQLVCTMYI